MRASLLLLLLIVGTVEAQDAATPWFMVAQRWGTNAAPPSITRTAKGTNLVANATSCTISSIQMATGDWLIVCANSGGAITLKWNNISMTRDVFVATENGIWSLKITNGATADLVATRSGKGHISLIASSVSGLQYNPAFDKSASASGSGTSPSSGATATLSSANEIAFGLVWLGSLAPVGGTWNNGFNDGQALLSNIATSEGYLVVNSTASLTAAKTGTTSDSWGCIIATYR